MQAKSQLSGKSNVEYEFKGYMTNDLVIDFYQANSQDFIINLSSSEGIPVSLMEAMSKGIIPVATNVGEVSQIVNNNHGILLNANATSEEFVTAFKDLICKSDSDIMQMRNDCIELIRLKFNESINYAEFINSACSERLN